MQVQGELESRIKQTKKKYRNPFQGLAHIYRHEGVHGVQQGLAAGIAYQFSMNGTRLGLYPLVKRMLGATDPNVNGFFVRNLLAGAITGGAGAFVGSPFSMVKVRLQVQAGGVGKARHDYRGVMHALYTVGRNEGIMGLFQGASAAVPRVMIGSAAQLSTYDSAKEFLINTGYFPRHSPLTHFVGSSISGIAVVLTMNPLDVISTRLYNQNTDPILKTRMYSGPIDCAAKLLKSEGFGGFYKVHDLFLSFLLFA